MKDVPIGVSAGGAVLRQENDKWFIALEQQPKKRTGLWCLPKGHIEEGETLEQTARREILEEVGVRELNLIHYIGKKERLSARGHEWKIIHYFLFTTTQKELHPEATDKYHIGQWFDLFSDVPCPFEEQREIIEEARGWVRGRK